MKKETIVLIQNWNDLKFQFGLVDSNDGLQSASQLQKAICMELENYDSPPKHLFIPCNKKSDADAQFDFVQRDGDVVTYEYIGTCN